MMAKRDNAGVPYMLIKVSPPMPKQFSVLAIVLFYIE